MKSNIPKFVAAPIDKATECGHNKLELEAQKFMDFLESFYKETDASEVTITFSKRKAEDPFKCNFVVSIR